MVIQKDGLDVAQGIPYHQLRRAYLFTAGSGSVAYDHSDNRLDATISGTVAWEDGLFDTALAFDNTSTEISIDDDQAVPNLSEYTIIVWAKFTNLDNGSDKTLVELRNNNEFVLATNGVGRLNLTHNSSSSNNTIQASGNYTPIEDTYHPWVARWDGSTVELLQGTQVADSTSVSGLDSRGLEDNVGSLGGVNYMDGSIQSVMIFDSYLSDEMLWRIQQWTSRWVTAAYLTRAGGKVFGDVEWVNEPDGPVLTSPDGSKYRLAVANDGTLSTESV